MDPVFIVMMLGIVGLLFFMSSRNRKRQRETQNMRSGLAVGDEVMTTSGMYGTITAIDGEVVTVESSPGVSTRWFRPAIGKKVDPATEYASGDDAEVSTETAAPAESAEIESGSDQAPSASSSTTDGFLSADQVRRPYRDEK